MKTHTCRACSEEKSVDQFRKHPTMKRGHRNDCIPCENKRRKENWHKNPERNKEYELQRNYGISIADLDAIREEQAYQCAICGVHEDDAPHRHGTGLFVDHCHETGKVRGLLCHQCNSMLGYARDSEDNLLNAIQYLRR